MLIDMKRENVSYYFLKRVQLPTLKKFFLMKCFLLNVHFLLIDFYTTLEREFLGVSQSSSIMGQTFCSGPQL